MDCGPVTAWLDSQQFHSLPRPTAAARSDSLSDPLSRRTSAVDESAAAVLEEALSQFPTVDERDHHYRFRPSASSGPRGTVGDGTLSRTLGRICIHPTVERGVIDSYTPLAHHFLKLPIGNRIGYIPLYCPHDDLPLELAPLKVHHAAYFSFPS